MSVAGLVRNARPGWLCYECATAKAIADNYISSIGSFSIHITKRPVGRLVIYESLCLNAL